MCPACQCLSLKPARRRVFCASLADVFDNQVDPDWRADLFRLIADTPNLDWLVLTKRIGNAAAMIDEAMQLLNGTDGDRLWDFGAHPWDNVWLGATIVNQEEADRDIPKLLATPAAVRFLSMEPLLGPVDLTPHLWGRPTPCHDCPKDADCDCGYARRGKVFNDPALHWVIVGGESGLGARPMHPDWARSLRDQCAAAGVPMHFKQWGEWMPISQQGNGDGPGCSDYPPYKKAPRCVLQLDGQVADEWPPGAMTMLRIGKKAAGRLLDGVAYYAFPEVR